MLLRWCLVVSAALAMSCGVAQKSKRDWLFLFPVRIEGEVLDREQVLLPLLARGAIIGPFEERNMPSISPVQMQVTEREWNLKLADDTQWTPEMFAKLAERWKSRYFATVRVVSLESVEGAVEGLPPVPPPPGGQLTTTAKIVGSLWDATTKKFIFEKREHVEVLKVGRPGPSDSQVSSERSRAVVEACKNLFKDFLKKFPLKPPSVGIGAGGGASPR